MLDRILNSEIYQSKEDALRDIQDSMSHRQKITDFTHNLYKYPACFPPSFPRTVINCFSKPDDWILDPFVGGGTSAIESFVARRNFAGTDINELAIFSSKLKTMLLSKLEISSLDQWVRSISLERLSPDIREGDEIYFQNVPRVVGNAVRKISSAINELPTKRLKVYARGALLRFGQIELEQRLTFRDFNQAERSKDPKKLLRTFKQILNMNIQQSLNLAFEVEGGPRVFLPSCNLELGNAAEESVLNKWNRGSKQFKLVLTSPPYPEKHILYHKWQIDGRAETRLPYWIIQSTQVENEPFYTMASRDNPARLEIYITNMMMAFENVNRVMEKNGIFIQVVAFSELKVQLPLYLGAMNASGFEEIRNTHSGSYDGRLWREVPNRRWFNRVESRQLRCKEVVLFHRKSRSV